jgi:NADH dehydrogenase FAD-containing subunit
MEQDARHLSTLQPQHQQGETARAAIKALTAQGHELRIVPQNLMELWVVATRSAVQNGLGMTVPGATAELMRLKSMFLLLPETPAIYSVWENLVINPSDVATTA